MRVTLLTTYYPPERTPAAKRMAALARALDQAGHDVTAVTLAPHYPSNEIYAGYGSSLIDRRDENGIEVVRIRPYLPPRTSLSKRAIAEIANGFAQAVAAVRARPDVVLATIPAVPLALLGAIASLLSRSRFVLDVRDLYWLYGVELGKVPRVFCNVAEVLVGWSARRADCISTVTNEQREYMRRRFIGIRDVITAPNAVDDEFFLALNDAREAIERTTSSNTRLRVVYSGLVGYAQGLGVLLEAASVLSPDEWEILIAGDGPDRAALERAARTRELRHVQFLGYLQSDSLVRLYQTADVLYAQLRGVPSMETALPTKLSDYMATGRPVIFGGRGAGARLLEQSGAGIVIEPDNAGALVSALAVLKDCGTRDAMGRAGRNYIAQFSLRSRVIGKLVSAVIRAEEAPSLG